MEKAKIQQMFDFEDFGADLCVDAKGQLRVYSFFSGSHSLT